MCPKGLTANLNCPNITIPHTPYRIHHRHRAVVILIRVATKQKLGGSSLKILWMTYFLDPISIPTLSINTETTHPIAPMLKVSASVNSQETSSNKLWSILKQV